MSLLVSVRKATLVMPVMGHPDKVLITVDSFQVCVPLSLKIKPGDLVLLFRANTFLPASTPEFANLEPQTEYDGQAGFVIRPSAPLLVNGKEKPIFNGMAVPVSDFPAVAMHIRDNMGSFKDDDALCDALRNSTTFQTYLNVVSCGPGTAASSGANTSASGSLSEDSLFGLRAFPAPQPQVGGPRGSANNPHNIIGFRPYFCPKLDMINMQDIKSLFYPSKADTAYSVTTYMVGSPMAVYFVRNDSRHAATVHRATALHNGRMGVCSRTLDLKENNEQYPLHWATAKKAGLPAALNRFNRSVVVHGVLVGSSIRDNYEGMEEGQHEFFAYAIADIDAPNDNTLSVGRMAPTGPTTWRVLTENLGLKTVPQQEDKVKLSDLAANHKGLMALADGPGWFTERRAGLVFRNVQTGRGFKTMSRDYIERYGEASIRNDTQKSQKYHWHSKE